MNKLYLLFLLVVLTTYGCSQQDIPTYDDLTSDRYVYFNRAESDSTETSFFFFPGQDEIRYPIAVRCTGAGLKDETFKLAVVEKYTTAPPDTYEIPLDPVMRAGRGIDTCWMTFKKTDLLNTTKVRLVVQLEESDDFLVGRTEYRVAIFWFHNIIAKPAWWDSNFATRYMGNYSDKKYQLFLDVVNVDLTGANDSAKRHYSLIFKKYLKDRKEAGDTVYEKDGTEMTVNVLGNLV